jgi:DNA gyrase subunit A
VQADAILKMTLGQLVNLEQERLGKQHAALLDEILEYQRILSDDDNIRSIIRDDLADIKKKLADPRRTEISGVEIRHIDLEDLIEEEDMVVSISHKGYIKRTPVSTYRAQRRGGKGIKGAKIEDEDPIEHVFAASTHDYLLFFTTFGTVHWRKVHELPALSRESRGRAIVNLVPLAEGESVAACRAIRDFSAPNHYLMMATEKGLVKKTPLADYGRPRRNGIIAIKLRDDDSLIKVVVCQEGEEIVLSTASGMAIRFAESDARPMGRNTSGVKGISLVGDDKVVGMVVADPEATLLTACEKGYGKRTLFGPNKADDTEDEESTSSSNRYRAQKRGGKGVRDIKTTDRNGPVIGILPVAEEDEVLLMTSMGKIQRIRCADINTIGRNTQGVRIMGLSDDDSLAVLAKVPPNDDDEEGEDATTTGSPAPDASATESPESTDVASSTATAEPDATPDETEGK